ncbi:hypothetical protein CURTO8I2_70197 [Curtobacterium sp. 8I-2]|nr:hypothetical protein CURTO8I2_70197 [Curtobacterium sp. 8I-2]
MRAGLRRALGTTAPVGLVQGADRRETGPEQGAAAAFHLVGDGVGRGFHRAHPREFESVLPGLARPRDRDDVGQRDRVLPLVGVHRGAGQREVLGHGERGRARGQLRERHRPEVLLQVAEQCGADRLAEHHATGHQGAGDRTARGDPQQHPDLGHDTEAVGADGDRFDVADRQTTADVRELLVGQPAGVGIGGAQRGHAPCLPGTAASSAEGAGVGDG